jgi:CheY-like chemotaxis protein
LADPHLAHIPVVVCSGVPEGVEVEQLRAVAYLRKPVAIDALLSTIRALAERQRI